MHGDIFAVFKSSIYLQANDTICCLGNSQLVNGPINIRSDLTLLSGLNVGDPWVFANKTLTLGSAYRLGTHHTTVWNRNKQNAVGSMQQIDLIKLRTVVDIIEKILFHHSTNISSSETDNTTARRINNCLTQYSSLLTQSLQQSLSSSNEMNISNELKGIIGCGEGLTPAGDDILVGVLTTLHYLSYNNFIQLREWVLHHAPGNTSKISMAHLMAAANGQAVEYVHDILDTICINEQLDSYKQETLSELAYKLANYGSSSGNYALTGVLAVLKSMSVLSPDFQSEGPAGQPL